MDTFEAINNRASIREYIKKAIPKEYLEKIVDAARRAPTARGVEPWEFIIVTDSGTLGKIAEIADHGKFINDAGACLVIYCKETKYYLEDGCAACENALIATSDLGLGACWVAGDKKDYAKDVSSLLGVPAELKLICLISMGWPKDSVNQMKNRSLQEVLHWNKF